MPQRLTRIIAFGAIFIVIFDVVASLASKQLGFAYASAAWGSFLIQAIVGFMAGRAQRSVSAGATAAAIVGLTEATVGWWLSSLIGPSGVPELRLTPGLVAGTIVFVIATAAVLGAIGGFVGSRWATARADAA